VFSTPGAGNEAQIPRYRLDAFLSVQLLLPVYTGRILNRRAHETFLPPSGQHIHGSHLSIGDTGLLAHERYVIVGIFSLLFG
jgi:hypothetical protein